MDKELLINLNEIADQKELNNLEKLKEIIAILRNFERQSDSEFYRINYDKFTWKIPELVEIQLEIFKYLQDRMDFFVANKQAKNAEQLAWLDGEKEFDLTGEDLNTVWYSALLRGAYKKGQAMIKFIVNLMRKIVVWYDVRNEVKNEINVFMCTHLDCRSRNKNEHYKIPIDKPQCPIFQDNRCCGACKLASSCDHSVSCNCFGWSYAQLGGNDKGYYMHKASLYRKNGRIIKGKFDWDYYNRNKSKK